MATLIAVLGFVILVLALLGAVKAIMALLPYLLAILVVIGIICYLSSPADKEEDPK